MPWWRWQIQSFASWRNFSKGPCWIWAKKGLFRIPLNYSKTCGQNLTNPASCVKIRTKMPDPELPRLASYSRRSAVVTRETPSPTQTPQVARDTGATRNRLKRKRTMKMKQDHVVHCPVWMQWLELAPASLKHTCKTGRVNSWKSRPRCSFVFLYYSTFV